MILTFIIIPCPVVEVLLNPIVKGLWIEAIFLNPPTFSGPPILVWCFPCFLGIHVKTIFIYIDSDRPANFPGLSGVLTAIEEPSLKTHNEKMSLILGQSIRDSFDPGGIGNGLCLDKGSNCPCQGQIFGSRLFPEVHCGLASGTAFVNGFVRYSAEVCM
ncbi:hypothetical protein BDV24DRAFT_122348 [Aspergillus arachidicola]|uniref:Uncharacterized protein n=1 Tax=Aspergillus arachidicola TaxID=656916 RepID=A0A5N6YMX7_9EURO|nr:hypothetical protein BDV24DRAFT_122348 [Aspergillus arachidicola]